MMHLLDIIYHMLFWIIAISYLLTYAVLRFVFKVFLRECFHFSIQLVAYDLSTLYLILNKEISSGLSSQHLSQKFKLKE
jgi:hypothetical protein